MIDQEPKKAGVSRKFKIIAGLYLVWSLIGCSMYLAEHLMSDAAYLEAFGPELSALRGLVPKWATAGYAVGVWGGLAGVILLILRKKLSLPFFYASLAGAATGHLPYVFDGRFRAVMTAGNWVFTAFILLACIFMITFARKTTSSGILS